VYFPNFRHVASIGGVRGIIGRRYGMISHFDGQVAEMVSSLRWQSNPILALFITYLVL
jgi:hypothetical protein